MGHYANELNLPAKFTLREEVDEDRKVLKAFVEYAWPNGLRETIEITDAEKAGQLLNNWVEARKDF